MSVISNVHGAIVYESKGANKTKAFEGQRLVVTIAKASRNKETGLLEYGEHLQQTMATSVPMLTSADIDFSSERVRLHAVEYFKTVQNAIIADNLKSGIKSVTSEQLEQTAILNYLESESTGDKWDSERIAAWFTDSLFENVYLALIDKGMEEDTAVTNCKAYGKLFADCLSSKGKIPLGKAKQLDKALKLADKNDPVAARFAKRIAELLNEDIESALGL